MKFGMPHLFENPVGKTEHQIVKEQLDLMKAAEDLGFDSVTRRRRGRTLNEQSLR